MPATVTFDGLEYTEDDARNWLSDFQLHLEWLEINDPDNETEKALTVSNISKFNYIYSQF